MHRLFCWGGMAACCLLLALPSPTRAAPPPNTCRVCHTNAGMLIAMTRELAKGRPAPAPSLSEGEG